MQLLKFVIRFIVYVTSHVKLFPALEKRNPVLSEPLKVIYPS